MQFHILDENYVPVAIMDNDLPNAIHFQKSKMHRFSTGSADFFDFETSKIHVDSNKFQVGYWIAFKYDARDRLMYINDIQEAESDKMMSISTLSSNLDLNQEKTQPFSADIARPFSWYFDRIMFDAGYEIGINEISNLTRKLSWDSEMSHRAFLQSVATQFDNAELDYEVVLNSDFTVKSRLVHIKKQIGEVRDDIELRYGKNIKTVKRSTNIDNLYTAIRPISKDGNDKITTIASYHDWQQLDENGNVKFFHKKGENTIKAPIANARFGNRGISVTGGGYIVQDFSYDKISQTELFNQASKELETISVPAINYEVEGRTGAKIGDTVKIVDDGYSPELILSARVLEQVVSFDDATVEQATFGNYKALQSQISDDLIAKMQALAEQNAPYKTQTLTTNGLIFKNSQGNTTLTARLFKGTKEIVPDRFVWSVSNVISDNETNQLLVNADDINAKSVVRWSAVINDITVAFDEITITDVSDGADGSDGRGVEKVDQKWLVQSSSTVPTYAWSNSAWKTAIPAMTATNKYLYTIERTTYTDATTSYAITLSAVYGDKGDAGANGNDGIAGKDGVGVKTTTITYAISTSGTTAPTTGWSANVPTLTKGNYLWTKTVWVYTDNASETGYSVTYISKDGNNGSDGIAGKDGVGIKSTAVTYAGSTSGTTKPTAWTTTIPSVAAGSYLWTRYIWTYTDNTSETGYSIAKMGDTGPKGDTGSPGAQGAPGSPGAPGAPGEKGEDAWTVIMSNENVTLPANAQGGVTSYANSGTSISVMYGTGTALTPVASGATLANNQFKVTTSASNITAGAQTVDTTNKKINYAVASGMSTTSGAVASITYTISICNSAGVTSTVTKIQNFTKAEKGITGDKGIDSYTYIRYSASSNGANMTSLPGADSQYIGTCTTTQATAPTTVGSYVWAKFVGANGAKGDPTGITRSTTEPATRYTGMLWQYTGTVNLAATGITALPSSLYVWTGSAWQLYLVKSTNLQVDNGFISNAMIGDATIESAKIKSLDAGKINANSLEALSATIGKISNTFDNSSGGIDNKGAITIEDSIKVDYYNGNSRTTMDLVASSSGQGLFTQHLPDKTDTSKFKQSWYMPTGLYFTDSINNWTGQITAENVTLVPWTNLILSSGFKAGDGVQPQYRRIKNLDGSYTVQFRGAVSPTSGNFQTSGNVTIGSVSGVYTPLVISMAQSSDNTGKGARVAIAVNGNILILAPNSSSYVYLNGLQYIN